MKVEFKYDIGDTVKTPLDQVGYIETCAYEGSNKIKYYVIFDKDSGKWIYEELLVILNYKPIGLAGGTLNTFIQDL